MKQIVDCRFLNQVDGILPKPISTIAAAPSKRWYKVQSAGVNPWDFAYEQTLEGPDCIILPPKSYYQSNKFPKISTVITPLIDENDRTFKNLPSPYLHNHQPTHKRKYKSKKWSTPPFLHPDVIDTAHQLDLQTV